MTKKDASMLAVQDVAAALEYHPDSGNFVWLVRNDDVFGSRHERAVWNAKYAGTTAGSLDHDSGYVKIRMIGKNLYAHRVAWAFIHGRWPDGEIDHVNGDRADNRACNLREVDRQGNMRNACRSSANQSGATGVKWHRRARKWQAQITVSGEDIYLGLFLSFQSAVEARATAERAYGFHENHGRDRRNLQQNSHG